MKHLPEDRYEHMKKIQEMERYCGIIIPHNQSTNIGSRLAGLFRHFKLITLLCEPFSGTFSERVDTLWSVYQNDKNKGETSLGAVEAKIYNEGVNKVQHQYLDKFVKLIGDMKGDVPVDMGNILEFLPHLLKLQAQKSAVYGRSYARHGDLSVFLNTERKWDRISNIMDKAMKEGTDFLYSDKAGTVTETFLDTVVDLASYALLWVGYIKETHPEAFQKFLDDNHLDIS